MIISSWLPLCFDDIVLSMLSYWYVITTRGRPTLADTADLHGQVPLSVLAGQVLVVPLQDEALVTEVLDDSALGQAAAGGWVAGVAPVLWFQRRKTH